MLRIIRLTCISILIMILMFYVISAITGIGKSLSESLMQYSIFIFGILFAILSLFDKGEKGDGIDK